MGAVKTERGRVTAGEHRTRPVEIHRRSESMTMLADGRPHGPKEWLFAALMALTVTGVLPMAAAAFLIWLFEPAPSWAITGGLIAACIGGAAWVWREL